MGESFVEKFGAAEDLVYAAVFSVADTARALRRVGSPLADELFEAVTALNKAHGAMSRAVNEELSRQVRLADHHIAEAVLASLKALNKR